MKIKITGDEIASLLVSPKPKTSPKRMCTAQRSEQLKRGALIALGRWGHLRTAELARILWPEAAYGEQLSQRLIKTLISAGLVMQRMNAVGTTSVVLTRPGAAHVEALGEHARHGLDLSSVSGATFIHRCLATRFGIEQELRGSRSYGEHALAMRGNPFHKDKLQKQFHKLPDLIVQKENLFDWIEVESAAKSKSELQKCIRVILSRQKQLPDSELELCRLVFVCDGRLNHELRIKKAASELWATATTWERELMRQRVSLVSVSLGPRSKWVSSSEEKSLFQNLK